MHRQSLVHSKPKQLNINLFIEYTKCNMHCPYCYVKDTSKDIDEKSTAYLEKIKSAFKALPYEIAVAIEQNGDALISVKMLQFIIDLSWLSNIRAVNFNTNLSAGINELSGFLEKVNTETLTLCCTYHQHVYKDYEGFKEKLRLLKAKGVATVVVMVAYPKGLEKFEKFKKDFDVLGTPLNINAFGGRYNGKTYPAAYTDSEKKFLKEIFYSEAAYEHNLERKKTKGIPCTSGVESISIDKKGNIYACRQDWMKMGDPETKGFYGLLCRGYNLVRKPFLRKARLGNIFSGFTLLDSHSCPHHICNCARDFHTTVDFVSRYNKTKHLRIYSKKDAE